MSDNIYKILIVTAFIVIISVQAFKKKNDLLSGNFEEIVPFSFLGVGELLITEGIFHIDAPLIFMYETSNEVERIKLIDYISSSETELALIGIGAFLCLISIFVYKYLNDQRNIKLLSIQAYNDNKIEYLSVDKINKNKIKEEYIDLIEKWESISKKKIKSKQYRSDINNISDLLEEKLKLYKSSSQRDKRAFTAIAPIPFIIYSGHIIPKVGFSEYLELNHTQEDNKLQLLDKSNKLEYEKLKTSGNLIDGEEVVIAVSTTRKIEAADLIQFTRVGLKTKHIYLENPSHSAICSVKQINDYANIIIKEMLDVKNKMPNIKIIHLICASKTSLMFRLGQLIDKTQMPIVINYQYTQIDEDNEYKYPWGLYINHNKKSGEFYLWDR